MKNTECCPLCHNDAKAYFKQEFFICSNCKAIFRSTHFFLTPSEEKKRYENHNNDAEDTGYQQFVSPITTALFHDFSTQHSGLDFGAGTGSAISKLLKDKGYHIKPYDPFFHNTPALLEEKYDYIACCEVIEHFHDPEKEFELLKKILKPSGKLYCMTHLFNKNMNFEEWYYKNDPTHVFIYQKETFEWIKNRFGFHSMSINNRLITFCN